MKMTTARCWVFGAGTVAALGFGGAQAFATPAPVAQAVCNEQVCDRVCDVTNRGLGGFCSSTGICVCWR